MKVKKGLETEYYDFVKANSQDDYSSGIMKYMHRWADLMESHIEAGEKIADFAEKTSCEADDEGITGFMYGCAVNSLAHFWKYGEELRLWHNRGYGYEGDGVVNPAVLKIG